MAESTVGVVGYRVAHAGGSGPSPVRLRGLASLRGTVRVRCTAADALSNLVAVLELTADGQMRCSAATRRPLTASMRLVQDALVAGDYYDDADLEAAHHDGGEPVAAFAWPMLLQAGGLARLAGSRLELTPRGDAVLARPCYQALGDLWGRWLRSVSHDELSRIEAIRGQRKPGSLTPATTRRAVVTGKLATVEPRIWIDVDTVFTILQAPPAPLAVARSPLAQWQLYLVDAHDGSLGRPAGRPGTPLRAGTRCACSSSTRPPSA